MLNKNHQDFLGQFINADDRYSMDDSSLLYLKHGKTVTKEHKDKALTDTYVRYIVTKIQTIKNIIQTVTNSFKVSTYDKILQTR